MRSSLFILVATLMGFASAQNGLPTCAKPCVNQFTSGSQIAGCPSLNIACICSNSDFLGSIACCLASACDADDQSLATQYAQNICKTAGVTNLPSSVSCTSTSPSATSVAPSASAATKNAVLKNVADVGLSGFVGGLAAALVLI